MQDKKTKIQSTRGICFPEYRPTTSFIGKKKTTDLLLVQIPVFGLKPYFSGIASLRSFLIKNGFDVRCVDPVSKIFYDFGEKEQEVFQKVFSLDNDVVGFSFKPQPEIIACTKILVEVVEKCEPRYLGFSLILGNIFSSFLMAEQIKTYFPDLPIIVGGPGTEYLKKFGLKRKEFIDYLIKDEGEDVLFHLLSQKTLPIRPDVIRGLSYQKNGAWYDNISQEKINNKSNFTIPDFYIFRHFPELKSHFSGFYPISLGRGCPFNCSFCTVKQYNKDFFSYPLEQCLSRVRQFYIGLINKFIIIDPICNGNPGQLHAFGEELIKKRFIVEWGGNFRLHPSLDDYGELNHLFKSGLRHMVFGVESASSEVLKHIGKYHDLQGIKNIFAKLRRLKEKKDLKISLQFMVGYPTETEDDFKKTLRFIREYRDIIHEVTSCSVFLLENERLISSLKNDLLFYHGESDWGTNESTPEIRWRRLGEIRALFEELSLTYRIFYDDKLQRVMS